MVAEIGAGPDDVGKGAVKIIDAKTKAIIASVALSPCELGESFVAWANGIHTERAPFLPYLR